MKYAYLLIALFFADLAFSKPDTTRVFELCDLSYSYLLKDQDSALYYGEKAIELAKAISYDKGLAQAYNDLGLVYYYQSDYDKVAELWNASLGIRKQLQDSLGMAAIYNKLGAMYYQLGQLDKSLENQLLGLEVYERVNHVEGIAKCLNNVASVYEQQGMLDEALRYYEKAIDLKLQINDYLEVGGSMLNVASVYLRRNQLEKARIRFIESIDMLESHGHGTSIYAGAAYNNLGRVYHDMDSLPQARKMVLRSIAIRTELGDQAGLVSCKNRIGMIELKSKAYETAREHLQEGAQISESLGLIKEARDSYELLTQLHREQGNYEKALMYSDKYHAYKDSIYTQSSADKIAELQTQYETEKKEQQIAIQQAEIAEQQAQNRLNIAIITGLTLALVAMLSIFFLARSRTRKKQMLLLQEAKLQLREAEIEASISSQEKERTRFAQDLHDGFGQMISILNLNLKSLEKEGADREQVFEQSTSVLEDMYKELKGICFNLMPQTLIKNGIADAVREFAHRVNQAGKLTIETDFFGLDERMTEVQEISLYRIIQEWINNMLKYSDANRVNIQITKDEEELTLMIEDDGTGFDLELLKSGKGNGWRNMNSRVNLMKGELDVDTQSGMRGSTLVVNAPCTVESVEAQPV